MIASMPGNKMHFGAAASEACIAYAHRHAGSRGRFLKLLAAAAALMSVAACAGRSDLGYAALNSEVPATRAIIVPPPGGPSVVAVLQQTYQNGISQEIALSTASLTSGQNAFYVSLLNNTASNMETPETLSLSPLTPDRIEREMEERIPGVAMQTSLVYVQNKFGPFGFATGRSASGDLCLYAWQQIEPDKPAILVPGGAISVRLRLCDADASVDQLLRVMYGYTIAAYYRQESWNPYSDPPSPPAGFGQLDAPMYPLGLNGREDTTVIRRRVLSTQSRRTTLPDETSGRLIDKDTVEPAAPAPSIPQNTAPLGGYPLVPPPPSE
jgi:Cellulose biosynthesis protein BcsN